MASVHTTIQKVSAPAPASGAAVVSPCYIEVNNSSLTNVGDYVLQSNGHPVFNIGIIFAANINYDATSKKAVLYYNPQVTNTLNSGAIKQLQSKGIKVLMSLLGNHAGVGVCNFPTQDAAVAFAQEVANAVVQYNLDGIDIDDEYADYNPAPNDFSFVYFVQALRKFLSPEKIITWYFIGPATVKQSYNGVSVGSFLKYSWNAYYGSFMAPNVPGLSNQSLSAAAVQVNATSPSTIQSLAQSTLQDHYGVFMFYNLPNANTGSDYSSQLSAATQVLYGSATKYVGSGGGGGGGNLKTKPTVTSTVSAAAAAAPSHVLLATNRSFEALHSFQTVHPIGGARALRGSVAAAADNGGGSSGTSSSISTSGGGYGSVTGVMFSAPPFSTTTVSFTIHTASYSANDIANVLATVKAAVTASEWQKIDHETSTSASGSWSWFTGPRVSASASDTKSVMSGYGLSEANQASVIEQLFKMVPTQSTYNYTSTINNPTAEQVSGQMMLYNFSGTITVNNQQKQTTMLGNPVALSPSGAPMPSTASFN